MRLTRLFLALALSACAARAQDKLPAIKSNSATVSIQDGKQLKDYWTLSPDLKPDVYEAELIDGKPHKVTFITDVDSISFTVEEGKKYDFIIQRGDDLCYTRIVGRRFVPAARFDKNFPASNDYDSYRIIFSPLVAYNQSTTWFESDGFKELQPHVNFPYPQDVRRYSRAKMSPQAEVVFRGNIVFTEINHGYINPEADKHAERIRKAISNRDRWVEKSKGPGYYGGMGAFNEYMNWGLVSLRIADYAPREEQDALIAEIDKMMTERRGFPQFEAFDKFLVSLYRNRAPGQTLADLYPQIIEWFEKNN